MNKLTYILWFALIGLAVAVPKRDRNDYTKSPHRLVCYFASWAHYRKVDPFDIDNIDTDRCTHLNYAFAKLNEDTLEIEMSDPWSDAKENLNGYERFNNLRKKNPNLTTMISLGGWKEGSEKFSEMAKIPKLRHDFVTSVVEFLKKHDFDGLDLDWEFPGLRGGNSKVDKTTLSTLLKELREAFDPLGYVLTAVVASSKKWADRAYNIPDINKYVDWINLMAYEFHGGFDKQLGHNSPLYARPDEVDEPNSQLNVNFSVNYFIEMGAQPKKIVLGMPFYGTGFTLTDAKHVKLHDQANGYSPAGFISGEKGIYGYNEICQMTDSTQWVHTRDTYYKAPFTYNDQVWIGYDDVDSIACKSSYIKKMGLSGGMIWGLDYDDFKNRCGAGSSPLLHKVQSLLNGVSKNTMECKF